MKNSMFTKKEKRILNKLIKSSDLLDIEIATIIINKYPKLDEMFYDNYEQMLEIYDKELCEIFRKCLDIIWTEARE